MKQFESLIAFNDGTYCGICMIVYEYGVWVTEGSKTVIFSKCCRYVCVLY